MSTENRNRDREVAEILEKERAAHALKKKEATWAASAGVINHLHYLLGPMLAPLMDWEDLEESIRWWMGEVYDAALNTESGMRTQDAMQSSMNVFRAVLAGAAIGSKDPEQIAQTKELLGIESEGGP